MSEISIFIFGCFVFGISLAGTLVLTIGASQHPVANDDRSLPVEAQRSLSELKR